MDKKSILLVKNTKSSRILLRDFLKMNHYNVYEAQGYQEAVAHLIKNHVDLVITDHCLPERDGFEVIQTIRKIKPTLSVIMLASKGKEHIAIKALRFKVADYLKKPVELMYLKNRLAELLSE